MTPPTALVVVGVGGAGVSVVNHLAEVPVPGVCYVVADTSAQSLAASAHHGAGIDRVLLADGTRGLGTGGDVALGERAARCAARRLGNALGDAPIVVVVAGLGGGTGAGAGPIVASIGRARGAMTLGFGILPFPFEAPRAFATALRGRGAMAGPCHAMFALDNAHALATLGRAASVAVALRAADEAIRQAVDGLVALAGAACRPNAGRRVLDCDLARMRTLLQGGEARLGVGFAVGGDAPVDRALEAAMAVPDAPPVSSVLVHVTAGDELMVADVERVATAAGNAWAPGGPVALGVTLFAGWCGVVRVLVLGTGLRASVADAFAAESAVPLRRAV